LGVVGFGSAASAEEAMNASDAKRKAERTSANSASGELLLIKLIAAGLKARGGTGGDEQPEGSTNGRSGLG
jgi:hypothetical protein